VALRVRARALVAGQTGAAAGTGRDEDTPATGDTDPAGRDEAGSPVTADDHLTRAVADFTAEAGSLVEALDDLGSPGAYSEEGYPRLLALAAGLRALRRHVGRPLPEIVTEVERALGLDIEVAARPGSSQAAARADLDAFADAAAAFAGDAQEPTLGAFLAYLSAAETEEFGLEQPIGDTDRSSSRPCTRLRACSGPRQSARAAAGTRAQNFRPAPADDAVDR
jgi:DNA helicase-2/ATP-dependent DNA helicase PcrA